MIPLPEAEHRRNGKPRGDGTKPKLECSLETGIHGASARLNDYSFNCHVYHERVKDEREAALRRV